MATTKFSYWLIILISYFCILSSSYTMFDPIKKGMLCCSTCQVPTVFKTFNDDSMQLKQQLYGIVSSRLDPYVTYRQINKYPPEISKFVWQTATNLRAMEIQRSADQINQITDLQTFYQQCSDYICLQSDIRLLPIGEYVDPNVYHIDQVIAVPFSIQIPGERRIDTAEYMCWRDKTLDDNDCVNTFDHYSIWIEDQDNKALWDKIVKLPPYKNNKYMAASEIGFLIHKWEEILPVQFTDIYYMCSMKICSSTC